MELFDIHSELLDDKHNMTLLLTVHGKALLNYLAIIFEKLNVLNKEFQGTNMPCIVNSKATVAYPGGGQGAMAPPQTGKSGGQTIIWPPPFEVYKIFFLQIYIIHYYLLYT